jgi:hypothetical protein
MNIEKMQLKGQLAEAKKKYSDYDLEAAGIITLIRSFLNPWETDITRLEIEKVYQSTRRLHFLYFEMKALKKRIYDMEEALG